MSRRVSRVAVALLALALVLQSPSAFAMGRDRAVAPESGITRVVQTIKKIVRNLVAKTSDDTTTTDPTAWPVPPKP